jgi:hypothetical protein
LTISCKNGHVIGPGEFHQCQGPSAYAPWLQEELQAQTAELRRIRELLEKQSSSIVNNAAGGRENPEAKGRAAKRETR